MITTLVKTHPRGTTLLKFKSDGKLKTFPEDIAGASVGDLLGSDLVELIEVVEVEL